MTNATRQSADDEAPATLPQIAPPPRIGQGHPDFTVFQGLMDLQRSVAEVKASVEALTKTVDGTKSKVDKLVEWKNKILGGAMVLGAVIALFAFLITKFSSYVTFKMPEPTVAQSATNTPAQSTSLQPDTTAQKSK